MTAPWLHIIGIGEDGLEGLAPAALAALHGAEVIIGGERHHSLAPGFDAERLTWPRPYRDMIDTLSAMKRRSTAILVTGDPVWFSAGIRIAQKFPGDEVRFHPHVSAFQLACARMHWSLPDVVTRTVHGRPAEDIRPYVAPGAKLVLLTRNSETPADIAALLADAGYGGSRLTVLGAMGGPRESRLDGLARSWSGDVPHFHTLCVECIADIGLKPLPRGPGLPDEAFRHDGKMTKRDIRAVTLAKLAPHPHHVLWDIGTGCGSIAIEWMRSADYAAAIGIEPNPERRRMAERNARALGTSKLVLIDGMAPDALGGLTPPDAIFIGGGLSAETVHIALAALRPYGRLVVNAVTLESERLLIDLHREHGGDLIRLSVSHADTIGGYRGWRPAMPVTQWSLAT